MDLFSPAGQQTHGIFSPMQTKEIYDLVVECQVLGTQLTKEFHTLMGLEAIHCTVAQVTAHETINEGHPERGAAYGVPMNKDESDQKHEEILWKLCREADKAWVDTNNVVFDHQLHYDAQLTGFMDPLLEGDCLKPGELEQLCCITTHKPVTDFEKMTDCERDQHLYTLFGCIEGYKSDEYMRKWLGYFSIMH